MKNTINIEVKGECVTAVKKREVVNPKALKQVRIYDNGGEPFDRYTAVFMNKPYGSQRNPKLLEALGFSGSPFAPNGFGQHTSALPGRHLGKRIKFEDLNADCQQFIKDNI